MSIATHPDLKVSRRWVRVRFAFFSFGLSHRVHSCSFLQNIRVRVRVRVSVSIVLVA